MHWAGNMLRGLLAKVKKQKSMKKVLFKVSVMVALLLVFSDCEQQIVGPVPNFDYQFPDDPIPVEDVTTEEVVPGEITPGSISTAGQTTFGSDLANVNNNPTAAATVLGQINTFSAAVSTAQVTAVNALNVNTLPTQVKDGVADPNSNLISLIASIQGILKDYPQLASLVPNITLPTGGRFLEEAASSSSVVVPLLPTGVNAVTAVEVDCEAAAQRVFTTSSEQIEADYNANLAVVSTQTATNTSAALASRTAAITAANDRYTARNLLYRTQYDAFLVDINRITVFTAEEISLMRTLNILIYAMNLYNSTLLLNAELTAISDQLATNLQAIETANTTMTNDARTKRNAALAEATARFNEQVNTCHNQGGATGGD